MKIVNKVNGKMNSNDIWKNRLATKFKAIYIYNFFLYKYINENKKILPAIDCLTAFIVYKQKDITQKQIKNDKI